MCDPTAECLRGHPPASLEARNATFTLILNDVQMRRSADDALQTALTGQVVTIGGEAHSGSNGRARLDLTPDGTIIRIGPETIFTLVALEDNDQGPFSMLQLLLGQVWINLSAGRLEIETPSGLATVRGSLMSVEYSEQVGMEITCMEGHCTLGNDHGTVELTGGESSSISDPQRAPTEPEPMSEGDYQEWQEISPEALEGQTSAIPPDGGIVIPDEAKGKINTRLLTFSLTNNCTDVNMGDMIGDWRWQFQRLEDENGSGFSEQVVIPSGETVSGTLPAGQYMVTDWFPNGQQHGPATVNSDDISLKVMNCPDGRQPPAPLLPNP